jgi:hypothetical protein
MNDSFRRSWVLSWVLRVATSRQFAAFPVFSVLACGGPVSLGTPHDRGTHDTGTQSVNEDAGWFGDSGVREETDGGPDARLYDGGTLVGRGDGGLGGGDAGSPDAGPLSHIGALVSQGFPVATSFDGAFAYLLSDRGYLVFDVARGTVVDAPFSQATRLQVDRNGVTASSGGYVWRTDAAGRVLHQGPLSLTSSDFPNIFQDAARTALGARRWFQSAPRQDVLSFGSTQGVTIESAPFTLGYEFSTATTTLSADGRSVVSLDYASGQVAPTSWLRTLDASRHGGSVSSFELPISQARFVKKGRTSSGSLVSDAWGMLWHVRFADGAARSLSSVPTRTSQMQSSDHFALVVADTVLFAEQTTANQTSFFRWHVDDVEAPSLLMTTSGQLIDSAVDDGPVGQMGVGTAVFATRRDQPYFATAWLVPTSGPVVAPCAGQWPSVKISTPSAVVFQFDDRVNAVCTPSTGSTTVVANLNNSDPHCVGCFSRVLSIGDNTVWSQLARAINNNNPGIRRHEVFYSASAGASPVLQFTLDEQTSRLYALELFAVRGGALVAYRHRPVGFQGDGTSYTTFVRGR